MDIFHRHFALCQDITGLRDTQQQRAMHQDLYAAALCVTSRLHSVMRRSFRQHVPEGQELSQVLWHEALLQPITERADSQRRLTQWLLAHT